MSNTWIQEKPGLALAEDLKFNSTVGPPALKKFSEVDSTFANLFTQESISDITIVDVTSDDWGATL